jgi:hypothetical protein
LLLVSYVSLCTVSCHWLLLWHLFLHSVVIFLVLGHMMLFWGACDFLALSLGRNLFQQECLPDCLGHICEHKYFSLSIWFSYLLLFQLLAVRYCQVSSMACVASSSVVISNRSRVLLIDNFLMYAILWQAETSVLCHWS